MADDWDSIPTTAPAVVNKWEGEDQEDDDALDAWDAEPEEPKPKGEEIVVEKKKAITKRALARKEEEERKLQEKMAAAQLNDPNFGAQERERLRRLEEARDAALAGSLFGEESVKPRDATSDLPGAANVKPAAAASSSSSSFNASAAAAAQSDLMEVSVPVAANSALKTGARIEEVALETDADVDKFVSDIGKRLALLGKSVLASKKIAKILTNITDETIKLGVLRVDDVGELKRVMTIKHNDMTAKVKKGDKKKPAAAAAAKPTVALARNAFMHGDNFGSHADENGDDYDFI